jgi:hypothetical protein
VSSSPAPLIHQFEGRRLLYDRSAGFTPFRRRNAPARRTFPDSTILTLSAQGARYAGLHTLTEGIALRLLARDGIAAIWQLQMAAAAVYRTGDPIGAASILRSPPPPSENGCDGKPSH